MHSAQGGGGLREKVRRAKMQKPVQLLKQTCIPISAHLSRPGFCLPTVMPMEDLPNDETVFSLVPQIRSRRILATLKFSYCTNEQRVGTLER